MDCCDRETLDWAASTGGYDSDTVQDVMLRSVERRFGDSLPASPVEWLTDNGSAYRAHETRAFAREIGLEPRTTAVRSPQSNGIAESFVKTMKRDYIEMMPNPDSRTAVGNLAIAVVAAVWVPSNAAPVPPEAAATAIAITCVFPRIPIA